MAKGAETAAGGAEVVGAEVKADFYVKPNGELVPSTGCRYTARNPAVLESAKSGKLKARPDGT